jgi:predicted RND superfamily exporter protein
VRALADKWNKELPEPVRISGIPIIQRALHDNIRHDLVVFGIAALALFSLALFVVYRMPRFVVIPIVCCLLPAAGMLGAMSILGIPIALVTSNMPVLLFVLMLPYNVYFIERYRERRAFHPEEDGLASTLSALRTIVVPCFFSCATTLAGFVALSTSKVLPIRDFGGTKCDRDLPSILGISEITAEDHPRAPGLGRDHWRGGSCRFHRRRSAHQRGKQIHKLLLA